MVEEVKKVLVTTPKKKRLTAREREELLIGNFIELQKVMTNLSIKFENLSDNISNLLTIFELSARDYLSRKQNKSETDKDLLDKVNSLMEQNRTIAKGIIMIDDKVRTKIPSPTQVPQPPQQFQPSINLSPQQDKQRIIEKI
jgi:hypothetical protein